MYDVNDLHAASNINFKARKAAVYDILGMISREASLRFKQTNFDIDVKKVNRPSKNNVIVESAIQAIAVTGKVISEEDGEGLPGVNVLIKGTATGTVTDVDGNYRIEVPNAEAILVFSSIGYLSEELAVGNQTVINLTMRPDIKSLEEIVVIGYGTQKKSNLTGAVSSVKASELQETPITSIDQGLVGRASGVMGNPNFGYAGGLWLPSASVVPALCKVAMNLCM